MQIQALDTTAVAKTPTTVPTPAPATETTTPPAPTAPAARVAPAPYPSYRFEIGIRVEISLSAARRENDDEGAESLREPRSEHEVEREHRDGDPAKRAVKTLRKALHRATKPLLRGRDGLDHEGRHDLRRVEHDLKHDLKDALKSFRAGETDVAGFVGALADAVDRFERGVQQVLGIDPAPVEDPAAPLDPVALPQTPLTPQAPILQSAPIDPAVIDAGAAPDEPRQSPASGEERRFPAAVDGSADPSRAQGVLFDLIDEIQSVLQSISDALDAPRVSPPPAPADPPAFEAPMLRLDIGVSLDLRV